MKYQYILSLMMLFVALSCSKPTVESETKRWEANMKNLSALTAKYPGFEAAINEIKNTATAEWEKAKSISEEEKKVQAMRTACNLSSSGFIDKLDGLSYKLEKLKDLVTEAAQAGAVDQGDIDALRISTNEANLTLNEVEGVMRSRTVSSATDATAVMDDVYRKIANASDRVLKVKKNVLAKKKKIQAEKDAANKKIEDEKKAAEDAKKPVKCSYCGSMNPAGTLKCSGCGASIQ